MKVENMTSNKGNKIANQFIITDEENNRQVFQSYETVIAMKQFCEIEQKEVITLDREKWDYSVTTGKYRNLFLGETKKETQAKINSGEYFLDNLNQPSDESTKDETGLNARQGLN